MKVLAIDPGTTESAFVLYDGRRPLDYGIAENDALLTRLWRAPHGCWMGAHLAVEMIASYGMPVGAEVFETCVWIGRFIEAWKSPTNAPGHFSLVYRQKVKLHLCGLARAKDSNIRTALIDRFGPGKDKAVGTKKAPGPLYGIKSDVWQALALAVTFADGAAS